MVFLGQGHLLAQLGADQGQDLWVHLASQAQEQGHQVGQYQAGLGLGLQEDLEEVAQVQGLEHNTSADTNTALAQ